MKKTIIILAFAFVAFSCNKTTEIKEVKTAYIDTSKLMDDYTEAKDIREKYKAKSDEMGKQLQEEVAKLKAEEATFKTDAQAKGQAWAQQKGMELQKREQQLSYVQNAMLQQLQQGSDVERDSLVKTVKKFIKAYGKEKGYDYIYGTGEMESVMYAKDKYDITNEIVKLLNEKYKSSGKKEEITPAKTTGKK